MNRVPKMPPLLSPSLTPIHPLGTRITSKQKINEEKQGGFSPAPQGGKISFFPRIQLLVIDLNLYRNSSGPRSRRGRQDTDKSYKIGR